jgi:hypothetical protein
MRVVITRTWQVNGFTPARLDAGQVFDVRASIAMYLFAMHCAERAGDAQDPDRDPVDTQHAALS